MSQASTQKRINELARQARQHGHYVRTEWEGYVFCPLCRREVTAPRYIDYAKGRPETWPFALDRAMREHLAPANELCSSLPTA